MGAHSISNRRRLRLTAIIAAMVATGVIAAVEIVHQQSVGPEGWQLSLAVLLAAAFVAAALGLLLLLYRTEKPARCSGDGLERLEAILASANEGIVITNDWGRVEKMNPAAELMFGTLAEDARNDHIDELLPHLFGSDGVSELLSNGDLHGVPLMRESVARQRDGSELPARLWLRTSVIDGRHYLIITIQDLTELKDQEERLEFLEQRDVLTGLLNRKEFERRFTAQLFEAEGTDLPHVLCYIDVDHFKVVNDTCGHAAGDELMKQLAVLVESKLSEAELIGRIGGDELAVLFVNRSESQARELCVALMQTVRSFPFTWRDQSFDIAVSIGLTEFLPESDSASDELAKADMACHMAKQGGRDRIHIYREGDRDLIREHGDMRLVSTIARALAAGDFRLYAQAILPLAADSEEPIHHEVLVRMVDQVGNPVVPDSFIPAAERYILMPEVDRWIIHRLFELHGESLRQWHKRYPDNFLFAVNLSGTSIMDEAFLRYLKRQFEEWSIPYPSICFEITETAAVRNLEGARAFMTELNNLGSSFALDDFGTGLASYTYLRELPVRYLKIDGGFVRGMQDNPVNLAMVDSINQIGHVLGLQTIAEWAEDRALVDKLRELGIDYAQGFEIGRPIPVEDVVIA